MFDIVCYSERNFNLLKGFTMPLPMHQKPVHPLSSVKYIIAIAAGKGGVGKSSVAVNLALAIKSRGYQVGLMDTDLYGPSVRRMLPEDRLPEQRGQLIVPALCSGIKMISIAYFRKKGEDAAVVRAPIANSLITQFIQNIDWGPLDFLFIDFPPGTGDIQLTLSQRANLTGAIMVTTPQEVAVMDVRKAMHLFDQVKVPLIGVIENMSYYVNPQTEEVSYLFGRGGGERLANERGIPFLGQIPIDPLMSQCGDEGKSLFDLDKKAEKPVTQAFCRLADQTIAYVEEKKKSKGTFMETFELIWKEM